MLPSPTSPATDTRNPAPTLPGQEGGERPQRHPVEEFILPVSRAIEAVDGQNLTPLVLDDDHAFRSPRGALRQAVRRWFAETCRPFLDR